MNTTELKTAKAQLYKALLEKPREALTESEVQLMFTLAGDQDIQDILQQ